MPQSWRVVCSCYVCGMGHTDWLVRPPHRPLLVSTGRLLRARERPRWGAVLGKHSCSVLASSSQAPDVCFDTPLHLAVALACYVPAPPPPPPPSPPPTLYCFNQLSQADCEGITAAVALSAVFSFMALLCIVGLVALHRSRRARALLVNVLALRVEDPFEGPKDIQFQTRLSLSSHPIGHGTRYTTPMGGYDASPRAPAGPESLVPSAAAASSSTTAGGITVTVHTHSSPPDALPSGTPSPPDPESPSRGQLVREVARKYAAQYDAGYAAGRRFLRTAVPTSPVQELWHGDEEARRAWNWGYDEAVRGLSPYVESQEEPQEPLQHAA